MDGSCYAVKKMIRIKKKEMFQRLLLNNHWGQAHKFEGKIASRVMKIPPPLKNCKMKRKIQLNLRKKMDTRLVIASEK